MAIKSQYNGAQQNTHFKSHLNTTNKCHMIADYEHILRISIFRLFVMHLFRLIGFFLSTWPLVFIESLITINPIDYGQRDGEMERGTEKCDAMLSLHIASNGLANTVPIITSLILKTNHLLGEVPLAKNNANNTTSITINRFHFWPITNKQLDEAS